MKTKVVTKTMTILLICMLTLAWSNLVRGELTVELAYDDGTWDSVVATSIGGQIAVKFSLPTGWTCAKLLTAKYAMADAGRKFRVHIYDSDGVTELTTPFEVTPPTIGWFEVDVSGLNIVVCSDFYITKEQIHWDAPRPHMYLDSSPPISGRSYIGWGDPPHWGNPWPYDFGIRAVVEQVVAPANVNIDPDTLNLKSNGEFVTAYIQLPEGYDVADIVLETVYLEGVQAITDPTYGFVTDPDSYLLDLDGDGIAETRMVKFDRATVRNTLTGIPDYEEGAKFYDLTLTVFGVLADGTHFEGSDTIKVIGR